MLAEAALALSLSPHPVPALCTVAELFARPLIVGASISADHKSVSPGRVLARRHGSEAAIVKVAVAGQYGRSAVPAITDAQLKGASVVVGIDLFFWDGTETNADCRWGLAALDEALRRTRALGRPLILGNIPRLPRGPLDWLFIPAPTRCRERLNAALAAECRPEKGCWLVDFESVMDRIVNGGGLVIGGKPYGPVALLPDGRHPGPAASDYMADRIVEALGGPAAKVRCEP